MRVLFRCDAGTEIGTGHVMRCLTLAKALRERGHHCEFASRVRPGDLVELTRAEGFPVHELPAAAAEWQPASGEGPPYYRWLAVPWADDAEDTAAAIGARVFDWLLVDHYGIDERWQRRLRGHCRRLMAIDDLADRRHDCDLLLDQNFGRERAHYDGLVPVHCRSFLGSRYLLLRDQFERERARSLARRAAGTSLRHVLVMMGGVDRGNASGQALEALAAAKLPQHCHVSVLLGPHAPWIDTVRAAAARMPRPTEVLVGVDEVAALMADCDLAIGSGGTGVYERIYMGLPSLVQSIADNQEALLRGMESAGLLRMYRDAGELSRLLEESIAQGGLPLPPAVVADGRALVCDAMAGPQVVLERPRPLDLRRTFRWLRDPRLREEFLLRGEPQRAEHFQYWRRLLADPDQRVFSILADGRHVGNAGIRALRPETASAELWIYLGEAATRGAGIGARALRQIEDYMRGRLAVANSVLHVGTSNEAAQQFYRRAGYAPADPGPDTLAFAPGSVLRMEKKL